MLLNWIICRPICHEAKGLTGNPTGQNDKSDPSLVVFSVSQANSRPQYLQITAARHCRGVEYEKLCRGGYNYLTSRFKQNVIYQIFGCRDTNLCTHTHNHIPRHFETFVTAALLVSSCWTGSKATGRLHNSPQSGAIFQNTNYGSASHRSGSFLFTQWHKLTRVSLSRGRGNVIVSHMASRSLSCRRVEDAFHIHLQITAQ